jgi:anti-sigma regulatory factor (Ser/Thr protein kinase)
MAIATKRLRIDADLNRLADVRRFVRGAAETDHAPVACLDDLVQAVDEAATNAIVHGYRGQPGWLEVAVGFDGSRFIVTMEDDAPTFDPTSRPEPDLDVPPERRIPGGMGVHLMRAATDELSWQPRLGGGNILKLIRARLQPQEEEPR